MAARRALLAQVMDYFKWPPEVIAGMTERQIHEYALHAREKEGGVRLPRTEGPELTEEAHVAAFRAQAKGMGLRPDKVEAKVREIRAHYAGRRRAKGGEGGGGGGR